MIDPLRARYDAIPYRHGAVPDTHPARIGAIARLLGLPAAAPDRCRVLELGCAEGMNLLPLAERLPGSEFVGVDFSTTQIALAEETRAACGLANARFVCADLREFEPEAGSFDYVIAHGVYSWVSDEVKERLLAICARALAPAGVAYASYNTLPGWGLLGGLRAFLRTEIARVPEPAAQIEHASCVLRALAQSLAGQPGAYAAVARETVADMLSKPSALLFHDELAQVNDPCTFADFTAHAGRHGLHYLAEAHYATMPAEHLPASVREPLEPLGLDFLRTQQFMDVIFQRWLRNSLLCRQPLSLTRAIEPRVVEECALSLRMQIEGEGIDLQPGARLRLLGPNGLALEFTNPLVKAFLAVLAQAAPRRMRFAEAVERANDFLSLGGLPAAGDLTELRGVLYRLFALDALDLLLAGEGGWLRSAEPPAPSPLMRYQTGRGFPVANRWHELVEIAGEERVRLSAPDYQGDAAALEQAGLLA